MLPSEQFELAIYRWVKSLGVARSVNIPDFLNMPGSNGDYALVVERLKDLDAHGYILLRKITGNYSVPYSKFVPMHDENVFFGGGFIVEIAPGGRKFFEGLETRDAQEQKLKQEAKTHSNGSDLGVDASIPSELAQIPTKPALLSHLKEGLDKHELMAVMFIDLDGFKQVNDTLGHDEGDKCLKRVVEIIGGVIVGKGKLYRPGGDEFVVVFRNFDQHEAAATAERIRATIDKDSPGGDLKVTVSIGVTDSESESATDATALFKIADAAMYRAKKEKNRVVVYDGIDGTKARMPEAVSRAVYGETDDLYVGSRVHVLEPIPGLPREQWGYGSLIWVIREIDRIKKTAKATPVLPSLNGPTPTVEGPMSGPESPFKRSNVPS